MGREIDLSGRVALVVGGGGGGIGTGVVDALAGAGADIGAITFIEDHAADTRERVTAAGRRLSVQLADVTDDDALVAAVAAVSDELGPVQVLVNVVGGARAYDLAASYEMAMFDDIVARNLRYTVLACREVASRLIKRSLPGSIVNVSSIASAGFPFLLGYAGAKAAVEATSRTMAVEWGRYGIRVNVILPGSIRTPHAGARSGDALQSVPLGRQGEPRDIADVALFLASDLASYVTGQCIRVDGGSMILGPGGGGSNLSMLSAEAQERVRAAREAEAGS